MTEQEITIQLSDDPFDTKTVKVQVPHGTRLLSNESYAADVLSMYGVTDPTLQKTQLIEDNNAFTTRGEVSFISEDRERALIDIESKYTAFCTLTKEPDYIVDQLKVGMEIDVKIRTNKKNGDVIASISEAIKEVKLKEIKDAIGDIVVVLTNLAYLEGFTIEDCIDAAYSEIAPRQGKMINGTFIKNED